MPTRKSKENQRIKEVQAQFAAWRRNRKAGDRIPESLCFHTVEGMGVEELKPIVEQNLWKFRCLVATRNIRDALNFLTFSGRVDSRYLAQRRKGAEDRGQRTEDRGRRADCRCRYS